MWPTKIVIVELHKKVIVPYNSTYESFFFLECLVFVKSIFGKCRNRKCNLVFWVCYVLYIDVLSASMGSSIRFCIYEHILNYIFKKFSEKPNFRKGGDAQPAFFVLKKLLLRPWDLSHRLERQKLMVTSQEKTAVRPKNGLHIEGAS